MAPTGLLESFLGAIQASLSVLLVLSYGSIAAWSGLLDHKSTKAVSKICVRMFLPALLITKIGSELHAESVSRYGIIFVWAIVTHIVSFLIGLFAQYVLGMKDWVTVALMFNNSTSYPLLLVTALDDTGILSSLIVTDESSKDAVERAKSYFLVYATVSSCLTFAVGPRLIDSEHAPEADDKDEDGYDGDDDNEEERDAEAANEETGLLRNPFASGSSSGGFFPYLRRNSGNRASVIRQELRRASYVPKQKWKQLSPRTKWWLLFISDFFNAPLLGALLGLIIGLVPALQRAFFNDANEGGIFTAWLTASLKNIGGLFVPLPVVVAGVSLYTSMKEAREHTRDGSLAEAAKKTPWWTFTYILVVRFLLWPAASIGLVYAVTSRTEILGDDPMLWFTMMLMPTGPSAMKLITLVQVSEGDPEDETNIAKLLTLSYVMSPILSLTVVGSLLASQANIR
ncbi:auxin efflux carrier [Apodospora peruviana]|uniref:Auxin efflux carrier n=1 Tax=Apodospora peruviana TaxID=516989 RepID=A0AAE0IH45_9PEZI|nr:auxin efflux carrier [Apodospora peruviana]